jgi:hypothetical protein
MVRVSQALHVPAVSEGNIQVLRDEDEYSL